jgi:excisionase family DNA binding protein
MTELADPPVARMRVGQAAEMLGVSVETLRRWETEGRLTMARSEGGQRLVDIDQVANLLAGAARPPPTARIIAQSARNRFIGIDPSRPTASRPSSRCSRARIGWSAS